MEVEVLNRQVLSHPVVNGSRVMRTREAIIASALALAETGDVAPIVRDIAKMAGVSARTVFQHFADTAELYVAVLDRVFATGFGDMAEPGAALSLEGRVQLVVDRAADRYERLLPMWTFVETLQRRSPPAADMIAQVYATNQGTHVLHLSRDQVGRFWLDRRRRWR
jgi:AcrR family transcriptional regulator